MVAWAHRDWGVPGGMHPNRVVGATALAMIAMLAAAHAALALDAPVLHTPDPVTNTPPQLTWNQTPGASGYEVYRGSTCGNVSDYQSVVGAATTSFVDAFVNQGIDAT